MGELRTMSTAGGEGGTAEGRCLEQTCEPAGEAGFMLLGLVVVIFLLLLALGVAAPRVARGLRREKEVESTHRAEQYVRAIQVYYRKVGHYPGSVEQLEKTNNQRFLRQKYVDPLTGKADWKLIQVGQAKTTVKGFFGQPLAGIAAPGLGSAAGMASAGGNGTAIGSSGASSAFGSSSGSGSAFGSSSGSGLGSSGSGPGSSGAGLGSSGSGAATSSLGGTGLGGASGSGTDAATSVAGGGGTTPGASGTSASSGIASQSATSFTGGGAPFLGVGSAATGDSIVVVNEQTTYPTWEFLYDPRIEAMKAKVSLLGGGPASTNATGLGSARGLSSGIGIGAGGAGAAGAAGGFGSTTGTGAAGSAGSTTGSGSSTGATTGSGSTTTPQ